MTARPRVSIAGLWILDVAIAILGALLLFLVVRLFRFDEPDWIRNAWTYLLGVPTGLVAISMLTHVLSNEYIERSIQVGFLTSVSAHLLLMMFATNLVLFRGSWEKDSSTPAVVRVSEKKRPPEYVQPLRQAADNTRPDYLKPVPTKDNNPSEISDQEKKNSDPAALRLDVAQSISDSQVAGRSFDLEPSRGSDTPPTLQSLTKELERPDRMTPPNLQSEVIEVPSLNDQDISPSDKSEPVAVSMERGADKRFNTPILEPPPTPQRLSDLASASPPNPQKKTVEAASIDQQLAQSLNVLQPSVEPPQRTMVLKDKPSISGISVPNVAIAPIPQDTPTIERSAEPKRSSTMPSPLANQQSLPRWDPSQRVSSPSPSPATNTSGSSNPSLNRRSVPLTGDLLSDQRFQPDSTTIERQPIGDLRSPPSGTSNVPIEQPPMGSIEPSESTLSPLDLSASMTIEKSTKPVPSRPSMGDFRGKPIELGSKTRIEPSAGIAPRQKSEKPPEMALPDLRPSDVSPNRFRKVEPSGPRIASSSVPIPSPAFSQRIRRMTEREAEASSALGPLGPQTELSIERGLQFLTEHQRRDGSWSLGDYDSRSAMQSDTAATALALLCFQGAGYTHRQFKYEVACKAALDWLISHQRENGDLYQRSTPSSDANAWLYSHSIATLALCEAYGMTQDESIKVSAQRAVNFLVASQDPIGGGWRYSPRLGSDTSVTGWVMMAFKSAELAGLEVPSTVYVGINRWIENSKSREAPYLYRYNWQANSPTNQHGRVPTPSMTSVGLLMRLYLGWRRDNENMQKGAQWLLGRLPGEGTLQAPMRDTYYWYYATQVMFHVGGEKWRKWYGTLYPLLIRTQVTDGEYAGSWDPMKPIPDAYGEYGGRLYVTTLNLLSLEVYYRHLPIYEATAK